MKKIAILSCLDACQVCTGGGCLRAWNEKDRYFAQYAGQKAVLTAFLHCNGCGGKPESVDPRQDPGIVEKLDYLKDNGVDVVHNGVCTVTDRETGEICPVIRIMEQMLLERGIPMVFGTH